MDPCPGDGTFETVKLVQTRWENETRQAKHVQTRKENIQSMVFKPAFRWERGNYLKGQLGRPRWLIPLPPQRPWDTQEESSLLFPLQGHK